VRESDSKLDFVGACCCWLVCVRSRRHRFDYWRSTFCGYSFGRTAWCGFGTGCSK